MRYFLRALVVAVILILGYGLLEPTIERALYTMRLTAMPRPGMLPVPVEGVRASALRDTWDGARSEGRKHEGIDIFAKRGTPVLSSTEGIVMQVGTNRLGGLVVWVMGPGGQRHYYAHLERYADVEAGMRIEAGRVLGYVGNTGNARGTPPHLHYGVYDVGGAINPYPLLRARPAAVTAAKAAAQAAGRPATIIFPIMDGSGFFAKTSPVSAHHSGHGPSRPVTIQFSGPGLPGGGGDLPIATRSTVSL